MRGREKYPYKLTLLRLGDHDNRIRILFYSRYAVILEKVKCLSRIFRGDVFIVGVIEGGRIKHVNQQVSILPAGAKLCVKVI